MNTYNIFDEENYSTILFHAIAESEDIVKELAAENNIDLTGLTIELERSNVKPEYGNSYKRSIKSALV